MTYTVRLIFKGGRVEYLRLPQIPQLGWVVCTMTEHFVCKSHPKIFAGTEASDLPPGNEILTGESINAEIEAAFARNGKRTDKKPRAT